MKMASASKSSSMSRSSSSKSESFDASHMMAGGEHILGLGVDSGCGTICLLLSDER